MQSPHGFLVTPVSGRRYDNVRNYGGIDVAVSVSEEDYLFSNRFAEVIELPARYNGPIKKGNTLVVHHNVFKYYNDIKGKRKSGKSYLADNLFLVEDDQYFMYKDDLWHAHDKNCFVKPLPAIDSYIKKPFSEEPLMGIMKYPNEYLLSKGVNAGDTVCFKPDSEYEFVIDGEKLFRIFDHQIVAKIKSN